MIGNLFLHFTHGKNFAQTRFHRISPIVLLLASLLIGLSSAAFIGSGKSLLAVNPSNLITAQPVWIIRGPFLSEPAIPSLSLPVRDLPIAEPYAGPAEEATWHAASANRPPSGNLFTGQSLAGFENPNRGNTPNPVLNFEGLWNAAHFGYQPNVNGDVGSNHYVQAVNEFFAIYDKSGALLNGPIDTADLFAGVGSCGLFPYTHQTVVQYDPLADRWLIDRFYRDGIIYGLCIAISQTGDPAGAYYRYEFFHFGIAFDRNYGVWPDAYYMGETSYNAYAFDRGNMLAGDPAAFQMFTNLPNLYLPGDLDGSTLPPAGSPNPFYTFLDDVTHGGVDRLELRDFHVDWKMPASSTFSSAGEFPLTPFTYTVCGGSPDCIPQGSTTNRLDAVSQVPMYRFPYRSFGDYAAVVGNFTIDTGGDVAGTRWFELRKAGEDWSLYQEGTFAPDGNHRWLGSIAMDKTGNIALGFSESSDSMFPAIRYAARLASDPLGEFQAEAVLTDGGGAQTIIPAWGNYSAMSVDPVDDCTFWYTNEYYPTSSGWDWHTRIGAFQLPECTDNATPTATPTQTSTPTQTPTITPTPTETKTPPPTVTNTQPPAPTSTPASTQTPAPTPGRVYLPIVS